jgi:hypothetical protein
MTGNRNDMLTTMLRDAAVQEILPPLPAGEIRRHAERARTRRRVAAVALTVAVVAGGSVAFQQLASESGLFSNAPTTPSRSGPPTALPTTQDRPTSAPSDTTAPAESSTDPSRTGDGDDTRSAGSATAWPAPPEVRGANSTWRPWELPGYDYGSIVSARMEDGHAVITFDREQLYTAEQWEEKTGEQEDMDFRIVNESTRTRQFVIQDDAPLYGNWLLASPDGVTSGPVTRYSPEQLVERINDRLTRDAVWRQQNPDDKATEPPRVSVFLFHSDSLNGPVAYLEEASMWIG